MPGYERTRASPGSGRTPARISSAPSPTPPAMRRRRCNGSPRSRRACLMRRASRSGLADGDEWGLSIRIGAGAERIGAVVPAEQRRVGGRNLPGTVFRENRQIHIPDLDNIDPAMADWPVTAARAAGARTVAGTPLRREGKAIGALIVFRDQLAPFTDDELALQQSFADQAAIAIENARLFNETREALERQTATADILKVIASSPSDVQPVFEAIASSAKRLLGGFSAAVFRYIDGMRPSGCLHAGRANRRRCAEGGISRRPSTDFAAFRLARDGQPFADPGHRRAIAHTGCGNRAQARLPQHAVGADGERRRPDRAALGHARRARRVCAAPHPVAADLCRPGRDRDRECAAVQRDAGSAGAADRDRRILKVIASSPTDVQPVFDAIAEQRQTPVRGPFVRGLHVLFGDMLHLAAVTAGRRVRARSAAERLSGTPLARPRIRGTVARTGTLLVKPDVETDPDVAESVKEIARARGYRSIIAVPMLRDGVSIGVDRRHPARSRILHRQPDRRCSRPSPTRP